MGLTYSKDSTNIDDKKKDSEEKLNTKNNRKKRTKILLLGTHGSGKSTIMKQMTIMQEGTLTLEHMQSYIPSVFGNILESMSALIRATKKLKIAYGDKERENDAALVTNARDSYENGISPELKECIKRLWNDKGIKDCFKRAREFQLSDSTEYYMKNLDRIAALSYIPVEQNILQITIKTTGIIDTRVSFNEMDLLIVDVGGCRSERKKWIHCFKDVTAVIFTVALSEYDQVLVENEETNRMQDSMHLFDFICNNPLISTATMILFLNKKDIFENKVENSPLTICFPDYAGENNYTEASAYIKTKFEDLNRNDTKEIFTHFTCATDTENIKVVFDSVVEVITKSFLTEKKLT
ncbi:guanine nucleotide-binding protein G(i) subunit alpha-3-like [Clavelina lepadiformis]|uniref:guanine nucleotide-binding protein G(i) subunit alpha-3-like n=1 Tax=Clavelina lepadiformis TaxID=159417 RepID=UPI0040427C09